MATDCRIVLIAESHIDGFRAAIDSVAGERRYLAFLEAPPPDLMREFVLGNIRDGHPQFVALVGDTVVGWCDVLPRQRPVFRHTGVLGVGVIEPFRGRGIGAALMAATLAAARRRDVTRIELHVREKNLRAIALYEKFGFVREGLMRRDVYVDGAYENSVMMAVLLDEA